MYPIMLLGLLEVAVIIIMTALLRWMTVYNPATPTITKLHITLKHTQQKIAFLVVLALKFGVITTLLIDRSHILQGTDEFVVY